RSTVTPLDQLELRKGFGHFPTGVTVVSFDKDGDPWGLTASSFVSISLQPPLVMVSIAKAARSHRELQGRPFTVNVLRVAQEELARRFAGGDDGARLSTAWVESPVGPRLHDALAHFGCVPWNHFDAGDHTLYLGQVVLIDEQDGDALGFYRSRFVAIPQPLPSQPITALDPNDPYELPYDAV
ncbi:MAG: flavin reductase family protein, partial [Solirubrobacteraceae bacterium]